MWWRIIFSWRWWWILWLLTGGVITFLLWPEPSDWAKARELNRLLADYRTKEPSTPDFTALFNLALQRNLVTADEVPEFLVLHAAAATYLPDNAAQQRYWTQLKKYSESPQWEQIKMHPETAMLLDLAAENESLQEFAMANQEWLPGAIWLLPPMTEPVLAFLQQRAGVAEPLYYEISDFPPPENWPENGYERLLTEYYAVMSRLPRFRLSYAESGGVLLHSQLNIAESEADGMVRILFLMHRRNPLVWRQAVSHDLVFQWYLQAPDCTDALINKYDAAMLAKFILTFYPDAAAAATQNIARWENRGLYQLLRHRDHPKIGWYLNQPQVGLRLVPFLEKFNREGFSMLAENLRWADRYFTYDGTPRNRTAENWSAMPLIGAPALLLANWYDNYPISGAEVGWAALDAADTALLVMSFGSSSGVSAVRQSGKAVLKSGVRQSWKNLLGNGLRYGLPGVEKSAALKSGSLYLWRKAAPGVWKWSCRGALAAGIYVSVKYRTGPEMQAWKAGVQAKLQSAFQDLWPDNAFGKIVQKIQKNTPYQLWIQRIICLLLWWGPPLLFWRLRYRLRCRRN